MKLPNTKHKKEIGERVMLCAHEDGFNKVKIKKLIAFECNDLVTCFRVGSE